MKITLTIIYETSEVNFPDQGQLLFILTCGRSTKNSSLNDKKNINSLNTITDGLVNKEDYDKNVFREIFQASGAKGPPSYISRIFVTVQACRL